MYSAVGSADHRVVNGSVEAWMWGNAETPPNVVAFADVCPPDGTTGTEPGPASTTGVATPASPPLTQYALFLVMALGLLGIFWLTRRRATG
jgi:hypothetical protein